MPEILIPAVLKGKKGEKELVMLANTGSDLVVLPEEVADEVGPRMLGRETEIEVGGGGIIKGHLCLIQIEARDPETGEARSEEVGAVVVKGQKEPLMGISALERLGVLLDVKRGKFRFA